MRTRLSIHQYKGLNETTSQRSGGLGGVGACESNPTLYRRVGGSVVSLMVL